MDTYTAVDSASCVLELCTRDALVPPRDHALVVQGDVAAEGSVDAVAAVEGLENGSASSSECCVG